MSGKEADPGLVGGGDLTEPPPPPLQVRHGLTPCPSPRPWHPSPPDGQWEFRAAGSATVECYAGVIVLCDVLA